jgi:elongation factor P
MIGVTELRKGVTFEEGGQLFRVLEYQHVKMGRGNAVIKTRLRNLRSGATIERTFNSGERVQDVRLDHRTVQYLYTDGDLYHFMDVATYEQFALPGESLGDRVKFFTDGLTMDMSLHESQPVEVELPTTVDLKVMQTAPGFKGDTATGGGKPATVETGLVVTVPFFVEVGQVIRVDTRTGQYVTRV